jgi:hypothetical protein
MRFRRSCEKTDGCRGGARAGVLRGVRGAPGPGSPAARGLPGRARCATSHGNFPAAPITVGHCDCPQRLETPQRIRSGSPMSRSPSRRAVPSSAMQAVSDNGCRCGLRPGAACDFSVAVRTSDLSDEPHEEPCHDGAAHGGQARVRRRSTGRERPAPFPPACGRSGGAGAAGTRRRCRPSAHAGAAPPAPQAPAIVTSRQADQLAGRRFSTSSEVPS